MCFQRFLPWSGIFVFKKSLDLFELSNDYDAGVL
jgi:hypothetical protein